MTTLTEIVAAVVVHSSAAAFNHFGLSLEPTHPDKVQAPAAHVVQRTPAHKPVKAMAFTVVTPPDRPHKA
jgi:hypothetical protein